MSHISGTPINFRMKHCNILNLFISLYGLLRSYRGIPFFALTPLRRAVRYSAKLILPKYLNKSLRSEPEQHIDVIVSFTSFPARINDVWQVVECMLRQTFRPKKVILWLSRDQFPTTDSIPTSLTSRIGDIFEIRLVEGDLRSHKKYYYAAKEFPQSKIVLIDDDLYYPTYMLEELYLEHMKHPQDLISRYAFVIHYDDNGHCLPYRKWREVYGAREGNDVFFGSGGGTLFTPDMMYKDLLDEQLSRRLTPIADDIWLNAMTRLGATHIRKIPSTMILPIVGKGSKIKLSAQNVGQNKNDEQIKSIIDYYKRVCGVELFRNAF